MEVERAESHDLGAIERLLLASGLPLDGARDAFVTGVVAREGGEVVGAAAIERYGPAGLLRSVAVEPVMRGTGIGGTLVDSSESLARDLGIAGAVPADRDRRGVVRAPRLQHDRTRRGARAGSRLDRVHDRLLFDGRRNVARARNLTGARRAGSQWWNDAIPARAMTAISPRRNAAATMTGSDAAKPDGRTADLLLVSATRLTRLPESRGFASPGHPGFAFVDQLRWPAHTWCAR